jgi:hypothetical protein
MNLCALGPDREFDATLLLNKQRHRTTRPKRKFHLQLLGSLVAGRATYRLFLLGAQAAALSLLATTRCKFQCPSSRLLKQVNGPSNRRVAQPREFDDLHHTPTFDIRTKSSLFMLPGQ